MQFEREELQSALKDASPALARTPEIPGLECFWFDGKHVYAYNGGLGVRIKLKADLDCGLPGKTLMDLIGTSALKQIELDEKDDGDATLKMGKSRVNLAAKAGDKNPWGFPESPEKANNVVDELELTEDVFAAFTKVSFARLSGKPLTAVHNGISVIPSKGTLEFYATDSNSMARLALEVKVGKDLPNFIAPWEFVDRFLALLEPGDMLYVLEDCLVAVGDRAMVCSNLLEFPDHPDMPKTVDELLKDEPLMADLPDGLQSVLDRASILSRDKEGAPVKITTSANRLKIEGKYGLGAVSEDLTLKGKVDAGEASFRAHLIGRGLRHAKTIGMAGSGVLVLKDGDEFVYLVSSIAEPKESKKKRSADIEDDAEEEAKETKVERRKSKPREDEDEPRKRRRDEDEDKPARRRRTRDQEDEEIPF